MPNVLLLINEESHIRELARVAELLMATPDMRPVVFMEDRMKHLGVPSAFAQLGLEVLTSDRFSIGTSGLFALGVRDHALRRLLMRVLDKADCEYIDINRRVMLQRAAVCEQVLSERPYATVLMSEDNVELDTGIWIAIARRKGIRSVIIPYTISNTAEFAESYVDEPLHQVGNSRQNGLVARLFPQWVLQYRGRHLLRTKFAKAIAVELLGLTPPNPWLLNSGHADSIAVESIAMRDYYLAAGLPERLLALSGSLTDDVLTRVCKDVPERRRVLLSEFGLQDDRPMLVCALPPDQNTYGRAGCEFSDFDDLVGFWGKCLSQVDGWNVVLRPHPKTSIERLNALRQYGINITYDDTAALVPLCDLYVACVSATIRWAIACGKPVINYDVYQYGYQDYEGVDGVALVNTRTEFQRLLQQLTTDRDRRARMAAAQKRVSGRWGCLDGMSGQRILALLRGEKPPKSRAFARLERAAAIRDDALAASG